MWNWIKSKFIKDIIEEPEEELSWAETWAKLSWTEKRDNISSSISWWNSHIRECRSDIDKLNKEIKKLERWIDEAYIERQGYKEKYKEAHSNCLIEELLGLEN